MSRSFFYFILNLVEIFAEYSAFALLQVLPWYIFAVADVGLCSVFASIVVLGLLFVSFHQFAVLSSLFGHSSSVPLPPLSLGA